MIQFFTVVIVIAAIILTFIVLIQNSKGGGLAADFSSANQVFGVKKTTDHIEKLTWILIGVIVLLSVVSARLIAGEQNEIKASAINTEQVEQQMPTTQQVATQGVVEDVASNQ